MVIEFLTGSAIAAIAKETLAPIVIDVLKKDGKNLVENLVDFSGNRLNEQTRQLIANISNRYGENYAERHGILKVLGMREPVSLDSVYTNVRLLDEFGIGRFLSVDNLEQTFRESSDRRFQLEECEPKEGVKVANEEQYLMVLGAPGSGKSTFLRKMGLEALKGKKGGLEKHHCIPVFLELKRFDRAGIDIQKAIAHEFEICGFPNAEKFTEKALDKGKLLILFDGLDEVPNNVVNEAIEKIQDFADRYDKNRFIASCRTAAYRSRFRRFKDLEMADFDDAQIEKFIMNWFQSERDRQEKTAEHCWELLQEDKHEGAKELAQTPLLLTFLCLVYDKSQNFPDNRSVLYRKALRILLEEWASEKRINRDKNSIYEGFHVELEEILLSEIAYQNFVEDRLFFEEKFLTESIKTFLTGNLKAPDYLDAEEVLNAIAVQQGIFVERAEEIYSFSHLTLQEYLTAQYINDDDCIDELVENHLFDPRWKEIFLLVAGLMKGSQGADRLLVKIQTEIEKLLTEPTYQKRLIPILQWAERETKDSGGELSLVAKRAVANAMAYAHANTYANTDVNTYIHVYARANAYIYVYARAYIDAHDNTYANAYAYTYPDFFTNTDMFDLFLQILIDTIENMRGLQPVFTHLDIPTFLDQSKALQRSIPGKDEPKEVRQAFAQKIRNTLLAAFNLQYELIDWTRGEAREIDRYHYATRILIECKEAAARVSAETWDNIEERMFRVPEDLVKPNASPLNRVLSRLRSVLGS